MAFTLTALQMGLGGCPWQWAGRSSYEGMHFLAVLLTLMSLSSQNMTIIKKSALGRDLISGIFYLLERDWCLHATLRELEDTIYWKMSYFPLIIGTVLDQVTRLLVPEAR